MYAHTYLPSMIKIVARKNVGNYYYLLVIGIIN